MVGRQDGFDEAGVRELLPLLPDHTMFTLMRHTSCHAAMWHDCVRALACRGTHMVGCAAAGGLGQRSMGRDAPCGVWGVVAVAQLGHTSEAGARGSTHHSHMILRYIRGRGISRRVVRSRIRGP
eukprot:5209513-Prymnesium_polylepis.2